MIVVRDIFQVTFGKMRDVLALWKEAVRLESELMGMKPRLLTDVVGPYYTLVLETECESLAVWEESLSNALVSDEWRAIYQRIIPLIESGRREIFTIVE